MLMKSQNSMSSVNLAQLEARLKPLQRLLAKVPLLVWQRLVRGLLVIWLAYVLAQLLWFLIPKPSIPPAKIDGSSLSGTPSSVGKVQVDIETLKKITPFGNPAAQTEIKPEINEQQAVDTQLNLTLRGLVYSSNKNLARAVIATSDKQDVYAVGDQIPLGNNVSVLKILTDRVIISNNGKHESLWLFKDDPSAPRPQNTYVPQNRSIDDDRSAANQPPVYYEQNDDNYTQPSPQMGATLSDVVAMSIHRENGQIIGYKIRPGRNAEMFTSLGLQTDDVVTAVNGMPLNNPGKIMEIYRSMGSATSANLQILRNGSSVNLDISLNR